MPIDQIDDPDLKFTPSSSLKDFVKNQLVAKDIPSNIRTLKKESSKKSQSLLNLKDIAWINNYLKDYRKSSKNPIYLHELMDNVDVCLPTPKVTSRNPVLEARIKRLTAQNESRVYDAMVKNVDPVKKYYPEDTISYQIKQINRHLIAVAQFIFSVMAAFAFGFIGVELILGNLDFGFRLLLGVMCALIVALAEIYFLAKKLNEEYEPIDTPMCSKLHKD